MGKSSARPPEKRETPMVRQYNAIKARYPHYIVMFRMGDFYEMFDDDAREAAQILGITLTRRPWGDGADMALAGVPFHAVEAYLAKFIRAGRKVAICDQVEDPKKAKGIVKREVTRIVTPGTILESDLLHAKSHNFLAAAFSQKGVWGLAVTDLSTGSFEIAEFSGSNAQRQMFSEIGRLAPAELLLPDSCRRQKDQWLDPALETTQTCLPDTDFIPASARRRLLEQFGVRSLEGFGAEEMPAAIGAAGALIQYLSDTQFSALGHINRLTVYNPSDFLIIDFTTQRSLELVQPLHAEGRDATLLSVLDQTQTAMGGRMLRAWILQPLKEVASIRSRLDAVEDLVADGGVRSTLCERLRRVHDFERIISRVGLGAAGPRDLISLRQSLQQVPGLKQTLSTRSSSLLRDVRERIHDLPELSGLLESSLADNPPYALRDGGVIREGFDSQLDDLRDVANNTSDWMERMRQEEIARTGIANLKIRYNKVFGYFIEVSRSNAESVPENYIRKQTLVNAERFITPELKEKEEIILHAQDRISEREAVLFEEIRARVARETEAIQYLANAVAEADCLLALSLAAVAGNYVKPEVDDGDTIAIQDGRHPVIEALQSDRPFVPNDVQLSNTEEQILLITGPNMAGKSTYIRQVALTVLMAQMGGFVPARSARIGVVDRIFTRVGAMDYLVRGQSTFLVEMNETANILNNCTDRSLVILDEIGRGTSTYDGLSIAWSVVEYLHSCEGRRPKTLFATHYHELTDLEGPCERVRNRNVAVLEKDGEITFLYKIVPGGTDHSYGIYAAKVAGLPASVIDRARAILFQLECGRPPEAQIPTPDRKVRLESESEMVQLSLFDGITHPALERLRRLDINALTPLQAMDILNELIQSAQ